MDNKASRLEKLSRYVKLLETQFTIPGTHFKFGIDPLLNFIPGLGSYTGLILGLIFIILAHKQGVSGKVKVLMFRNIVLDHILGSIPILGYVTDFFYKSNLKNMQLLEEHFMEEKHGGSGWHLIALFIFISISILVLTLIAFVWLINQILSWVMP